MNRIILLLPVFIVGILTILRYHPESQQFCIWLLSENRPVEWIQFTSFLLAGLIGFSICKSFGKKSGFVFWYYLLLSMGLIVVAMEEISWGQWIFYFEPPEAVQSLNKQGELNLHNMPILHEVFEVLRVVIGIGGLISIRLRNNTKLQFLSSSPSLIFYFLFIIVLAGLDLVNHNVFPHGKPIRIWAFRMVEVLELLISLAAFFYVFLNRRLLFKKPS